MSKSLTLASLLAIACTAAVSATAVARPVVVELFTSEGCSSCPPADRFLTELARRPDVLPLAFHVTYWNALGWRDPFSFEGATARQASYAAQLGGGSYTPEMVVDGRRGLVGSDRGEAAAAITASRGGEAVPVRLARSGDRLSVTVGAGAGRGRVLLIGFDPRHETAIGRGENAGHTLIETNVVRSITVIGAYEGAAVALDAAIGAGSDAAVLVQRADGRILGAARL